jgi:hypothetical protein
MSKSTRKWLILIVGLSAIVRMVHFDAIVQTAFIDFPLYATETDMFGYWQWSDRIIAGDWLGRDTYHPETGWMSALGDQLTWHRWWGDSRVFQQEPMYPYMLAAGRSIGLSIAGLMLVQLLIGTLQPVATFWLTRKVFRQDATALISAAIAGLYGPLVFYQGVMLRDWTGPLLDSLGLIALLWALDQDRDWKWSWPGIVFGVALMTRSTIMVFLPFMFAWVLWVNHENLSGMARRTAMVSGGVLAGFSPLLLRNVMLGVAPFKITNRVPEAIVSGNAADTFPLGVTIPQSMPDILEKAQGSTYVAILESLKTYNGDWLAFVQMQWLKFRTLFVPMELPNNLSFLYGQDISPVLGVLPDYGWLLPLGLLGVALVVFPRRLGRRNALLLVFGFATVLGLMASLILGRYRLGLSSFLFVYAGWALWQTWCWISLRRFRPLFLTVLALAGLVLIQQVIVPIRYLKENVLLAIHPLSYAVSSQIYQSRGNGDLAIDEWRRMQLRAEKLGKGNVVEEAIKKQQELHIRMAVAAGRVGRSDLANEHLSDVDRLFDQRQDKSMRDFALGVTFLKLGRNGEALKRLNKFIGEYPDLSETEQARRLLSELNKNYRQSSRK